MTENTDGALALPNGLKLVYGSYPAYSMITDTAVGGYSVTIPLSKYGLVAPVFSNVAVRYPVGFPRAAIHSVTPDSIKIGCDVNIKNCYVQWMVIG